MGAKWFLHLLFCLIIVTSSCFRRAINDVFPTANLSSSWISKEEEFMYFSDGSALNYVLVDACSPSFAAAGFGFYSKGTRDSIFLVIFVILSSSYIRATPPRIIWSANIVNPVKMNATLQLTSEGDLVLRDANGVVSGATN